MKIMKKIIKKHRHLVFMDFEGTQYSHELIAFGAVKVTLDKNYTLPYGQFYGTIYTIDEK